MDIETLRTYCLAKPGTTEEFPFDDTTLVFKVMGKMFATLGIDDPTSVNLKCDPDYAEELRASHPEVQPGYHMSKKHWNTVSFLGALTDAFILQLVDHSYDQVVQKTLTKAQREALQNL